MPDDLGGVAQGQDLGVRSRIARELTLVVAGGDHRAVAQHNRADRDVAVLDGAPRLVERDAHRRVICHLVEHVTAASDRAPASERPTTACVAGERHERREWDSNPRWVAPHTLSKRADSAALAPLPGATTRAR